MSAIENFSYGPHELQRLHVSGISGAPVQTNDDRYWVIYIHGGAWRDPTILADSFKYTEAVLRQHSLVQAHVAAFASIDYRLSPHPDFPQDPHNTPESRFRAAKHPDHLHDVQTALQFLQDKYAFGEKYILIGHSCGATLALQTVMNRVNGANHPNTTIPKPKAIVGVCGIYDLRLLRNDFKQYESVGAFIKGAFGEDEEIWDRVSPARVIDSDGVAAGWSTGQVAIVASSRNDSLINSPQGLAMRKTLKTWEDLHSERKIIFLDDLVEDHDDVWSKGQELSRTIIAAIESLVDKRS
ncbi:hypothetical protein PISL3812_02278 [Talaromyces islandicus]|uniref:Kynurenine formamidase n=1 Tax=Talaromyces islandicus TaxID=28573 RepID=A0A0U1LPG7_TALIS|nr:hypothetical protein PISL3812_02278 [Talaromyces islandicus]